MGKNRVAIIIALLFAMNLQTKSQQPSFINDSIDEYIKTAIVQWNIPGIAVAIVKDGRVILSKGYGVIEVGSDKQVDSNTLFMIASNSKAFAGTALALLEHEGRCSLNDKVKSWLPNFEMYNPTLTEEVTITDLLTHRMGHETFQRDLLCFYSSLTKEELKSKFPLIKPTYGFRERYGYSNLGYFWAGECIHAISEMSWDQYVSSHILNPLGMTRTVPLSKDLGKIENVAIGHTFEFGKLTSFPHTNADLIGPAAAMSSSVNDMSKWLLLWTGMGTIDNKEIIPEEVCKNVLDPRISIGRSGHPYNTSHFDLYGLGFRMEDYEGVEVVSHSGGIWGFVTGVTFVPEKNLGIVILTNSDENWFYAALKWEIIDAYLGLKYRNYSDFYHRYFTYSKNAEKDRISELQDTIAMKLPLPIKLKKFNGEYKNSIYGSIYLKKKGDGLELKLEHHPNIKGKLEWIGANRFVCTYTPSRMGKLVFPVRIGNDGSIEITLKVADRLDGTEWIFVKED